MTSKWTTTLIFAACLLAIVRADEDAILMEDLVAALEPFAKDCDPKPQKEHLEELILNKEDAQYETKCFRHCLMARFDMIEEDQTRLSQAKTADLLGVVWQDREKDINAIIEICNDENAGYTEKCENAHRHGMCMLREMKSRDFEIPEVTE